MDQASQPGASSAAPAAWLDNTLVLSTLATLVAACHDAAVAVVVRRCGSR